MSLGFDDMPQEVPHVGMYASSLPQEALGAPAVQVPVDRGKMRRLGGVSVWTPSSGMYGNAVASVVDLHCARVIQHVDLAADKTVGHAVVVTLQSYVTVALYRCGVTFLELEPYGIEFRLITAGLLDGGLQIVRDNGSRALP